MSILRQPEDGIAADRTFTFCELEKIISELIEKNDTAKMHEWFYQEPLNDLLARLKND